MCRPAAAKKAGNIPYLVCMNSGALRRAVYVIVSSSVLFQPDKFYDSKWRLGELYLRTQFICLCSIVMFYCHPENLSALFFLYS